MVSYYTYLSHWTTYFRLYFAKCQVLNFWHAFTEMFSSMLIDFSFFKMFTKCSLFMFACSCLLMKLFSYLNFVSNCLYQRYFFQIFSLIFNVFDVKNRLILHFRNKSAHKNSAIFYLDMNSLVSDKRVLKLYQLYSFLSLFFLSLMFSEI